MGQDIASYGGVFKVTAGFVDLFGAERVRNTPIIESGALGAALGLALAGYRPMVEMQFADFIACGFNQIVNNLAKTHYRTGLQIPVVIRAPHGGGVGAGPFHSQSVEGWFTSTPGLKVVAPATPRDAHARTATRTWRAVCCRHPGERRRRTAGCEARFRTLRVICLLDASYAVYCVCASSAGVVGRFR